MLGELFDPNVEWFVTEQQRPHWSQGGAIVFVTFRTHDSIPAEVLRRWEREKQDWLLRRGLADGSHWSAVIPNLDRETRDSFRKHFNRCREDLLDTHLGRCLLRQPDLAKIVARSLLHFDGERYQIGDFVIMPNHVHLMCAFRTAEEMYAQFDSWLHYTAFQINRRIGKKGKFWQGEPFDHLVRSQQQYDYLRDYIEQNPVRAKLRPGEFLYRRLEG